MSISPPGPVPGSQRLELLDALRGFALAGVLLANLETFTLYFFLSPDAAAALPTLAADRWLAAASGLLVSAKFITLFSIMFGIGFALLMQRIGQAGGRRWYLRRLAVLFLIGLLHSMVWWGDILRFYAVAGLLLLPLARVRPRNLAILGVALAYLPYLPLWQGDWLTVPRTQAYADALRAFTSEHANAMLRGNQVFNLWWWQSHWRVPASLPGLMLIGLALGNSHALRDPGLHARLWKWLLPGLPLGLTLGLVVTLADYGRLGGYGIALAWRHALDTGIVLMVALGYAALFTSLFARPGWHRWLRHLAPAGRMALSNYLGHTVVGIPVFYGVGLGLGPRHGMVAVVCMFVVLFVAQIAFSRWWLDRFRFGPAEWAWRSLTYGQRQPMRRQAADGADSTFAARP